MDFLEDGAFPCHRFGPRVYLVWAEGFIAYRLTTWPISVLRRKEKASKTEKSYLADCGLPSTLTLLIAHYIVRLNIHGGIKGL